MGSATYPPVAASSGTIKSVQRGLASGAGTVTITAVNIAKSFVTIFGTASTGAVAISSDVTGRNASSNAPRGFTNSQSALPNAGANFSFSSATFTGGTNNLVSAVVQGYLNSSTQLIVSGACRWEVVELN